MTEDETTKSSPFKDISPDKDNGVQKQIVREGKSWEKPQNGDKVEVDYVGKLEDGTVFDSSRDRKERFSFKLGKGEVIKGWDIAVKTMKRGELCNIIIAPDYGYGDRGSPPTIPPNANLHFEIELYDWRMEDLSKKKDGGVRKRVSVEGEGYSTPNEGSTVELNIVGKFGDRVFETRSVTFLLGEGSEEKLVEGIEIAVAKMKKGEKATVFIARDYAWGSNPPAEFDLPADYKEITYDVEVKNFEKLKEAWEMDSNERLEQSDLAKNKGSDYFKQEKYLLALKQYKRIPKYIGPPDNNDFEKEDKDKKDKILCAAYLNLAMTYLKLNKALEALKNCDLALEMDPGAVKGYFRRGQAYIGIKEYEKAIKDFEKVLELDPANKAAKNQIIQCKGGIKSQLAKEKTMYKNMFSKFAKQDDLKERRLYGNKDVWKDLEDEGKRDFKSDSDAEPVEVI